MDIYLVRDGQRVGPFSTEEVHQQLADGSLQPSELAWTEGASDWMPISQLPGFGTAAPPPIPTRPLAAAPAAPAAPAATLHGYRQLASDVPSETSGLAITSLVLGVLSVSIFPFLASIPAIVCGHMARSTIKGSGGRVGGAGMALAGLIMGYISLALLPLIAVFAILAGIALPVFSEVQTRGAETKSLSNAKQIAMGCKLYALDHQGAFPAKLEELIPDYLPSSDVFICPLSGPGVPMGFEYYGGKETDPDKNILLVSKALSKGRRRVVVHVDASGEIARDLRELPPRTVPVLDSTSELPAVER